MNISFVIPGDPLFRSVGKTTLVKLLGIVGERTLMIDEDSVEFNYQTLQNANYRSLSSAKNALRGQRFDHVIICRPTLKEAEKVLEDATLQVLINFVGGPITKRVYTVSVI